jgi:type VI secretion system secreted protein Hcp
MPGGGVGTDYFLKLDGIAGESTDAKHKDELELVSFSWGLTQSGGGRAGGGGGAGKAQFKDFQFLTRVSKASPVLFLAAASGRHLKDASLTVRRRSKAAVEFLKIKFTDVLITSFEQVGENAEVPHELVAFDFGKLEVQYTPQSARGAGGTVIGAGWDLTRNLKI